MRMIEVLLDAEVHVAACDASVQQRAIDIARELPGTFSRDSSLSRNDAVLEKLMRLPRQRSLKGLSTNDKRTFFDGIRRAFLLAAPLPPLNQREATGTRGCWPCLQLTFLQTKNPRTFVC
jgi:hypothetical protein